MDDISIRPASANDTEAIARIYNHYILNTVISFEEEPVTGEEMARRIEKVTAADLPWLVAEAGEKIHGYAYAGPWNERIAYQQSVETSVYLDFETTGQGVGSRLYEALFEILKAKGGIHAVIGGVALPNAASVALHEKFRFEKVAHYKEVGHKFDQWIDVGYWQRFL